jgi:hypothetical protein
MLVLGKSSVASVCIAAVALLFAGCSMHPLPEDVSRVPTYDIVARIRCEAQAGLAGINPADRVVRKIVDTTVIGYDFEFNITEDNNLNNGDGPGKLAFQRAGFIDGRQFSLDLTASAARKRENKRAFRIIESLKDLRAANCSTEMAGPNLLYPITGRIGMDEVVRTYIRLEKLTDVSEGIPSKKGQLDTKPIIFSEELDFTTTFTAGIKPTLELNTIAGKLRLTNASIFGNALRQDQHGVTVALARQGDVDPPAARVTGAGQRRMEVLRLASPAVGRDARSLAALAQKELFAPDRVLLELERRRILREDERLSSRLLNVLTPVP